MYIGLAIKILALNIQFMGVMPVLDINNFHWKTVFQLIITNLV